MRKKVPGTFFCDEVGRADWPWRCRKRSLGPFIVRKSAGQAGSGDAEKGPWDLIFEKSWEASCG